MRSPTLLLIKMKAADTRASSAMADCTPLAVVSRSVTTAEIETFISEVSTTRTNIAAASRSIRRRFGRSASVAWGESLLMVAPGFGHRRLAFMSGLRRMRRRAFLHSSALLPGLLDVDDRAGQDCAQQGP